MKQKLETLKKKVTPSDPLESSPIQAINEFKNQFKDLKNLSSSK